MTVAATAIAALSLLPGFSAFSTGPAGGALYRGVIPDAAAPQPLQESYVYLPPGYRPQRSYPVVYLLHGLPGDPGEYVFSLQLAQTADALIADGAVEPFVAVVPAAGQRTDTRKLYGGEWAGPWEHYLVDGVVPWVDEHLGVGRATLAGLSAGGYGAVDTALHHPGLFARVESWGGYFAPLRDGPFTHAGAATLAANDPILIAPAAAPALRADRTRFLLSSGPKHGRHTTPQATIDFAHELWNLHVRTKLDLLYERKGMWLSQLRAGLRWAVGARSS